jgi:hypothetical protein
MPAFSAFDPFEDALSIGLDLPFWIGLRAARGGAAGFGVEGMRRAPRRVPAAAHTTYPSYGCTSSMTMIHTTSRQPKKR